MLNISGQYNRQESRFGLNVFILKVTAIISMVIDHIGAALFPFELGWRVAGRLAFPIFAFLICEGYFHTKNVKRYAFRLFIFAIISEIPFNLLHSGRFFDPSAQNIFLTLLIGLLTIYGVDRFRQEQWTETKVGTKAGVTTGAGLKIKSGDAHSVRGHNLVTHGAGGYGKSGGFNPNAFFGDTKLKQFLIIISGLFAAQFLRADYGAFGVSLILIFYFLRKRRGLSMICMVTVNILYGMLNYADGYLPLQVFAGFAAIPLMFYNGKKGPSAQFLFYVFYPLHICVIMAVKYLMFRSPF